MNKIYKISLIFACVVVLALAFLVWLNNDLDKNKIDFKAVQFDIKEDKNNICIVTNEREFADALDDERIQIIDIENDLDLGIKYLSSLKIDSKYIEKHNEALIHPVLKRTGVSKVKIKDRKNLIIRSKTGSKILHTNFVIDNSENIKIENIYLDELWEWDEETLGYYSKNNWDFITIKNSKNVLINNCKFGKSYDGITDIKESQNITISNCEVLETDYLNNAFYNVQFDELEHNIDKYKMYSFLRNEALLSKEQVKKLSAYQFKVYLIGTEDYGPKNENIVIHDCKFFNVKTRVPQVRNSSVYFYNNYVKSNESDYNAYMSYKQYVLIEEKYPKIVALQSYGVIAIQRAYVVVENCEFIGTTYKYTTSKNFDLRGLGRIVKKSASHHIIVGQKTK